MGSTPESRRALKWWVISLLVIFVAEAILCALLFIPQARALRAAKTNKAFVEKQLNKLGLTSTKKKYEELAGKIGESRTLLTEVNLFSEDPAQEVIMRAIASADNPGGVVVLTLERAKDAAPSAARERARRRTRPKKTTTEEPAELGEAWRMRCRSNFDRLVVFLNNVERQGILLDSSVFSADTAAGDGTIEAEVLMRVFSRDALERLKEEAAAKAKQKTKDKSKKNDE